MDDKYLRPTCTKDISRSQMLASNSWNSSLTQDVASRRNFSERHREKIFFLINLKTLFQLMSIFNHFFTSSTTKVKVLFTSAPVASKRDNNSHRTEHIVRLSTGSTHSHTFSIGNIVEKFDAERTAERVCWAENVRVSIAMRFVQHFAEMLKWPNALSLYSRKWRREFSLTGMRPLPFVCLRMNV